MVTESTLKKSPAPPAPPAPSPVDALAAAGITAHTQELVALKSLHVAAYNPRTMSEAELDKLIRSLSEFGFVEPVVARPEDGLIIGGHQRLLAFRRLLERRGVAPEEMDEVRVPVVYIPGLSDERAKILNLALNKIQGEWDYGKLHDVLASLSGLEAPVIELSGFTMPEVEDVLTLMSNVPQFGSSRGGGGGGGGSSAADTATGPGAPADAAGAEAPAEPLDVNEVIAARNRRFVIELDNDDDAAFAKDVLASFGYTGPTDLCAAFLAALRAAHGAVGGEVAEAPAKAKRKKG